MEGPLEKCSLAKCSYCKCCIMVQKWSWHLLNIPMVTHQPINLEQWLFNKKKRKWCSNQEMITASLSILFCWSKHSEILGSHIYQNTYLSYCHKFIGISQKEKCLSFMLYFKTKRFREKHTYIYCKCSMYTKLYHIFRERIHLHVQNLCKNGANW